MSHSFSRSRTLVFSVAWTKSDSSIAKLFTEKVLRFFIKMGDIDLDTVRYPDSGDEVEIQSKFDERFFRGDLDQSESSLIWPSFI